MFDSINKLLQTICRGLIVSWLLPVCCWAQTLEIIELKHRPANDIIPIAAQLLPPGSTITGNGFTLFVRTTPSSLADLRRVIANLDVQQKRLLISVQQGGAIESDRQSVQGRGVLSSQGSTVELRGNSRTLSSNQGVAQQVQVMEGGVAYIANNSARLISQPNVAIVNGGAYYNETVVPQQASTGFYVRPRVNGDNVVLEISTQREAFANQNQVNGMQTNSVVSGRLGEWIELGGVDESASYSGRGIASTTSSSRAGSSSVRVRVDVN